MKHLIKTCILILFPSIFWAQSLDAAREMIYYEKFDSAEASLHQLLKTDPGNEAAWHALAQSYIGQDQVVPLKDSLSLAPADVREKPLFKSVMARVLLLQNDSMAAKQQFEAVLKETKMKDPAVLAEIAAASINSKTGDATYALELLGKAIKKDKKNPALDVLMGDAYRKLGDGGNAYKSYNNALAKEPEYAVARYKIGKIYTSQQNAGMYVPEFEKAVALDSLYAPALFELYYHYYYRDVSKAKYYLQKYIAASDYDVANDYLYADILYASGNYADAISNVTTLIEKQGTQTAPRLYKLAAYSYKELGDTAKAVAFMNTYFKEQHDTGVIAKDYEAMGDIYSSLQGKEDTAALFYTRAVELEADTALRPGYYKKISGLYKKIKDYRNEALWLGKYYEATPSASNVDLFNWGLASYLAGDYTNADTIFNMYAVKYPAEEFGYYWRAKTNAAIDTSMEMGTAIPHYLQLISFLEKDSVNAAGKKHLIEAYGYLAAYKANVEKDYQAAIEYFDKLLQLDPGNNDAKRYVDILRKTMEKNANASSSK